jgi:hypothetical protein
MVCSKREAPTDDEETGATTAPSQKAIPLCHFCRGAFEVVAYIRPGLGSSRGMGFLLCELWSPGVG